MYSQEQKEKAIQLYDQTKSVTETIRILGYPTRRNLYTWISEKNSPPKVRKDYPIIDNPPEHPRNPSLDVKLDAIHRCFQLGENIKYVSEDIGYSRTSIYQWRNHKIFSVIAKALKNGGKHFMDIMNGSYAQTHFPCKLWDAGEKGLILSAFE